MTRTQRAFNENLKSLTTTKTKTKTPKSKITITQSRKRFISNDGST